MSEDARDKTIRELVAQAQRDNAEGARVRSTLLGALTRYGRHDELCAVRLQIGGVCSCGYQAILEEFA